MNRDDLQAIAEVRINEARTLLGSHHTSGAYYLAGYAVECALKAVIASKTRQHDFPDKQLAIDSWTHDLKKLVRIAGLEAELKSALQHPQFAQNWATVVEWSEVSRYVLYDHYAAQDIIVAVTTNAHGVLSWITQFW